MSQVRLFEGWAIQKVTVDIPIYGKTSVNPDEPPEGLESLFPEGELPGYYDLAEVRGWVRVANIAGGSKLDNVTGVSSSDFTKPIVFQGFQNGFEVVQFIPWKEQSADQRQGQTA